MTPPDVTISLCSLGTRKSLLKTIELVRASAQESNLNYEILVVWSGRMSPPDWSDEAGKDVRFTSLAKAGLSLARNVALEQATASLVLFTDDDARPDSRWVDHVYQSFQRGAALVGGPYSPIFPTSTPSWARTEEVRLLYGTPSAWASHWLEPSETCVGGNMSVDRKAALELGGFDPRFGHGSPRKLLGEDVEFSQRLMRSNRTAFFNSDAVVNHHVHPVDITRKAFLTRMYRFGLTLSLLPERGEQASIVRNARGTATNIGRALASTDRMRHLASAAFCCGSIRSQISFSSRVASS